MRKGLSILLARLHSLRELEPFLLEGRNLLRERVVLGHAGIEALRVVVELLVRHERHKLVVAIVRGTKGRLHLLQALLGLAQRLAAAVTLLGLGTALLLSLDVAARVWSGASLATGAAFACAALLVGTSCPAAAASSSARLNW